MKVYFKNILVVAFLITTGQAFSQSYLVDKIIARVGTEYVLLSDLQSRISYIHDNYGEQNGLDCYVLQELLAQKLLINQAKLDSIEVTSEEIDQQISARIEDILTKMGNDESRFEEIYGKSVDEVRREQRENLQDQLYTDKMRARVMADAVATPAEVTEFFNSIPSDSLPYFNSEVEVSELVYKIKPNEEEKERARTKLLSIREQILSGKVTFEAEAKKYSVDKGSGENGGDLGWVKRGSFVPEYEAVAYNLEKGELSDIVESQFGFHLIELLERRGNLIHTRHILLKPTVRLADINKARAELDDIRSSVLGDSISFELAVRLHGDEDQQSFNNGGRMTNPKSGNTFFEIADLDFDVFIEIDSIQVDDITKPVLFDALSSDPYFKLLRLDSRTTAHKANLDSDYAKIQLMANERKKIEEFNHWVLRRVNNTYVDIDEGYHLCDEVSSFWLRQGQ